MAKEVRPLVQEQRKEFVQLLKDAKTRILDGISNRRNRATRAWDAAARLVIERLGLSKSDGRIVGLRKELKELESALKAAGFYYDNGGDLQLTSDGDDRYRQEISDVQDQILADEVETARRSYETAILNVLAAESVEEAKAIVEPLV